MECPEAECHTSSLIRILAQRRTIQEEAMKKMLRTGLSESNHNGFPTDLLHVPSLNDIEMERKEIQRALSSVPKVSEPKSPTDRMKDTMEDAVDPLRGWQWMCQDWETLDNETRAAKVQNVGLKIAPSMSRQFIFVPSSFPGLVYVFQSRLWPNHFHSVIT